MSRFRQIKREARRAVHRELHVPALYIAVKNATPVPCNVRVWRARQDPAIGALDNKPGNAQMIVEEDRIRMYLPELPAIRRAGAIFSVESGEAYRIDHLYPVDDEYQTARVVPLNAADAAGLPVPGDAP